MIRDAKAELRVARKLEADQVSISWSHFEDGEGDWPEPGWNFNWLKNHLFAHVSSVAICDNRPTSLETLKPFKHLTGLSIVCSNLSDIEALSLFPDLQHLQLYSCDGPKHFDLRPIALLKKLETVSVSFCNSLTKIDSIGECRALK